VPVVSIVYPADPAGIVPGGIDTFIRGIARHAPADIDIRLVGITTDPVARPVGRWTTCQAGERHYGMFPVLAVAAAGSRSRVPLSLRFSVAVARHRAAVDGNVVEFHRLEPALLFMRDARPKNAFVHQDMKSLRNRKSDILWSRLPWLYYRLEKKVLPGLDSVYVVVEDAVAWYQERFPRIAERFRFTPTWFDPADFRAPTEPERAAARHALRAEFGMAQDAEVVLSVGRLDHQKDPLLLAAAFARLAAGRARANLIYVGDGVLRSEVERFVADSGLGGRVHLAGLRDRREIARLLWGADLFALASAYEGMPMSVLEALGSGVPVVATDVGEVRRVVRPGRSGTVVAARTPEAIAEALESSLDERDRLAGAVCLEAAAPYTPARVLEPVYENYRRLAREGRRVA
jgi:glycosyltransferase involved in cell wall biosynthesis